MVGSQLDLSRHEHTCSPGANIGSTPLPFREGCQLHRHIALLTLAGGEDAISFQGLGSQAQGLSRAADKLVGWKPFQVQVHERPWSPLAQPCPALEDFPAIPTTWGEDGSRRQAYTRIGSAGSHSCHGSCCELKGTL